MKRVRNTAHCAKKASSENSGRNTWKPASSELREAKPVVGEKEALKRLRQRFADHEKIANALKAVYQNLTANEGTNLGVNALLRGAVEESQRIAEYDERFKALWERLQSAFYEAEEIANDVRLQWLTTKTMTRRNMSKFRQDWMYTAAWKSATAWKLTRCVITMKSFRTS